MCTKEVFHMLCLHRYVDVVGDISPHKVGRRFTSTDFLLLGVFRR